MSSIFFFFWPEMLIVVAIIVGILGVQGNAMKARQEKLIANQKYAKDQAYKAEVLKAIQDKKTE
jgi:hypothetical protein